MGRGDNLAHAAAMHHIAQRHAGRVIRTGRDPAPHIRVKRQPTGAYDDLAGAGNRNGAFRHLPGVQRRRAVGVGGQHPFSVRGHRILGVSVRNRLPECRGKENCMSGSIIYC